MGGGRGEGSSFGGKGGCDRRIEKFWENSPKKNSGWGVGLGGGGGVRVDVNEELKFLCKFKKNIYFFFGGGGGVPGWGVGFEESGWM